MLFSLFSFSFRYLLIYVTDTSVDFPTKTHKEFINDKSIQEITGKVSPYSQTSSDEFIAEVYAGLVSGKKFSDDVMALYKKYGGPALT